MAEQINYIINAQVAGGPKVSEIRSIEVEAYDKIQVSLSKTDKDKVVNIQPPGSGLTQFLSITTASYDKPLSYKVNDAAKVIDLNGPHIFIGVGAVGLLASEPTKLLFTNGTDDIVIIDILVGRDATP